MKYFLKYFHGSGNFLQIGKRKLVDLLRKFRKKSKLCPNITFVIIKVMSQGKIILGVLAGAAIGSLIGILFAPDKGMDTRKKIIHKGEEYVDDLKEKLSEIFVDGEKRRATVTDTAN